MAQIPEYCRYALKQKILDEFNDSQAEFCRLSGFRTQWVNDVLRGRKDLTLNMIERVAAFFGMNGLEFAELGREIVEDRPAPVKLESTNIISLYRHGSLALKLNKQLLEIEKLEPGRMHEFDGIIASILKSIKEKHEPFKPGREDRRSGQDRRQASGGG